LSTVVVFFSLLALKEVMLPSNACLPSCGLLVGCCWGAGGGGAGIGAATGGGGGGIPLKN